MQGGYLRFTVDGCEILHQLGTMKGNQSWDHNEMKHQLLQDFAGPSTVCSGEFSDDVHQGSATIHVQIPIYK